MRVPEAMPSITVWGRHNAFTTYGKRASRTTAVASRIPRQWAAAMKSLATASAREVGLWVDNDILGLGKCYCDVIPPPCHRAYLC